MLHWKGMKDIVAYVSPFLLQGLAWIPGRIALWALVSLKVQGMVHVRAAARLAKKSGTGVIFSCTHVSELDPIIVLAGVPPFLSRLFPMFYVSAPMKEFREGSYGWRQFFYNSYWFFVSWGSYPLVRGVHDYAASLASHELLLRQGRTVCIFPEGGVRVKKPEPGGGVGYLALATKAVVVPVTIAFTHKDSHRGFWRGGWRMSLTYHAPRTYTGDATDVTLCKQIAREVVISS